MGISRCVWWIRRGLWNCIIKVKYRGNKPASIPLPPSRERSILHVPLSQNFPSIPITRITVSDHIPKDERSFVKKIFYKFQMMLNSIFGPNQGNLPPVSGDPDIMLKEAYGKSKRTLFPAPDLPDAFGEDSPDLARLAVAGPYWGYLRATEDGRYEWDLRELSQFEHWPGLRKIGARVVFETDAEGGKLHPALIECELGRVDPAHPEWSQAIRLALCAITTHVSLVRHFNGVHLAIGAKFSIATRNHLPHDHPLCRLLWPHIYGSHYSNDLVTLGQMAPRGDFPMIFSFTHAGMCDLYEQTHANIRFDDYDPVLEAKKNNVIGKEFDTPTYENLIQIFNVFLAHTTQYLRAYYRRDEDLAQDEVLINTHGDSA